ncbi:hypothetical protein AB4K20DRAFT_1953109 [Rhizopus microsporus]|uniref:Uncharacterized protein n=1 Tax=Rhizopus microsporus TaxID=58291 RepID=A0A1X0RSV9_RHIZD|nr:hypothetical protein BCV71DRAFT_41047 [Rhizopus microsporus]
MPYHVYRRQRHGGRLNSKGIQTIWWKMEAVHAWYERQCLHHKREHDVSNMHVLLLQAGQPHASKSDKEIKKKVKGSFLCRNIDCVLVSNKKAVKPRDDLSALAIGHSGLCSLLFQETFPEISAKTATATLIL